MAVQASRAPRLSFYLIAPKQRDKKLPLLLFLHGSGENPDNLLEEFKSLAAQGKMAVLVPIRKREYRNQYWDLQEIYGLTDQISRRSFVDSRNKFVAGVSFGSVLASWLVNQKPFAWKGAIFISVPAPEVFENMTHVSSDRPPMLFLQGKRDTALDFQEFYSGIEFLEQKKLSISTKVDPEGAHGYGKNWVADLLEWLEPRLGLGFIRR